MELFRFIILNITVCSRTKVASVCLSPFFLDVAVCENWSRSGCMHLNLATFLQVNYMICSLASLMQTDMFFCSERLFKNNPAKCKRLRETSKHPCLICNLSCFLNFYTLLFV